MVSGTEVFENVVLINKDDVFANVLLVAFERTGTSGNGSSTSALIFLAAASDTLEPLAARRLLADHLS